MSSSATENCKVCGIKLGHVAFYIPEVGESCMKCFYEYETDPDNWLVTRKKLKVPDPAPRTRPRF
jgi:hypothetical protein